MGRFFLRLVVFGVPLWLNQREIVHTWRKERRSSRQDYETTQNSIAKNKEGYFYASTNSDG